MAKYIYSTLSNDQNFIVWGNTEDPNNLPTRQKTIMIAGKANVMNKANFVTPKGVLTTVEDDVAKALGENSQFKKFVERGYITVETKAATTADDAAKNMKSKDKSAQKTEADIKATSSKATTKVTTNEKK